MDFVVSALPSLLMKNKIPPHNRTGKASERSMTKILMPYLLLSHDVIGCCEQVQNMYGIPDIIGIRKVKDVLSVIEVEIKVTKSDFNSELKDIKAILGGIRPEGKKHRKHHFYLSQPLMTPNQFYFAVPPELETYAVQTLEDCSSPYGVLVVYEDTKEVRLRKPAKKLHREEPTMKQVLKIMRSMALYRLYEQQPTYRPSNL